MNRTGISWTNFTWNVWTGCKPVSPGCAHCYARRIAERYRGSKTFPHGFDLTYHWDRLTEPLRRRRPAMIFVNSMSDIFHEQVTDSSVLAVFGVMNKCYRLGLRHRFQVLTKRTQRMLEIAPHIHWTPNIWMGVSVEEAHWKARIDDLRRVPAAIRFISFEPLIGDVGELDLGGIHWVIVGGESGPGFREMNLDWARQIRDQCITAGVAFFFKQGSGYRPGSNTLLDGKQWQQYPQVEQP